eukprot:202978-Chlamydomonas_euryale.AAC.1
MSNAPDGVVVGRSQRRGMLRTVSDIGRCARIAAAIQGAMRRPTQLQGRAVAPARTKCHAEPPTNSNTIQTVHIHSHPHDPMDA